MPRLLRKALFLSVYTSASCAFAVGIDLRIDDSTGAPGKFAEAEIRREATAKGMALGQDSDSTQIAIIVEKGADQVPQSYRIQVGQEQGRRSITVKGADSTGAMYGGSMWQKPSVSARWTHSRIPGKNHTSQSAGSNSTSRSIFARRATPMSRTPPKRIFPRFGRRISGLNTSFPWRVTATT